MKPELRAATSLLLTLSLAGCQTPSSAPPTSTLATPLAAKAPAPAPSTGSGAVVAPIFEHGEGVGWFGCFAVNSISYLTEEEAWRVIDDELAKNGIALTENEYPVPGVEIPASGQFFGSTPRLGDSEPSPTHPEADSKPPTPLRADRADPRRKIVVEFVSTENPPEKSPRERLGEIVLSGGNYYSKGKADELRRTVAAQANEKIYFAALYDPMGSGYQPTAILPGKRLKKTSPATVSPPKSTAAKPAPASAPPPAAAEQTESASKALLREQVRDFIHWLQAQGAI